MSYKELQSNDGSFNTPKYLFNYLNYFFEFELDPCDTGDNYLGLSHSFTKEDNGLTKDWNYNTFVNPPYGKQNELEWIKKCKEELSKHREYNYFILLPAKTESQWFSDLFFTSDVRIFLRPRISFIKDGKVKHGNNIGSVIFGMRARNSVGLDILRIFANYNDRDLKFTVDSDSYDHYTIFADTRILKKKWSVIASELQKRVV